MSPLLDAAGAGPGRDPRLVLVPVGALAAVPWAAARSDDGEAPYACQRAVISYAVSARQLREAVAHPAVAGSALLIANPDGDLPWSAKSAQAVRDLLHPGARLLGRPSNRSDGPATTAAVLAALPAGTEPGVALLDLGCHARSAADPAQTTISLTDRRLTLERILDHAQGVSTGVPGGLVLLSACASALTTADHDEALTLASGFLAAGARSVIGTGWSVPDSLTAAFTLVLHQRLAAETSRRPGGDPARALAAAQRWMLDSTPVPGAPGWFGSATRALAGPVQDAGLGCWAAFTHHGA
jgi:CHAT domain-containing protein